MSCPYTSTVVVRIFARPKLGPQWSKAEPMYVAMSVKIITVGTSECCVV